MGGFKALNKTCSNTIDKNQVCAFLAENKIEKTEGGDNGKSEQLANLLARVNKYDHINATNTLAANAIALRQIDELLNPKPLNTKDFCACVGKFVPSHPACQCAMKNYFSVDGGQWYRVKVTIEKVEA